MFTKQFNIIFSSTISENTRKKNLYYSRGFKNVYRVCKNMYRTSKIDSKHQNKENSSYKHTSEVATLLVCR